MISITSAKIDPPAFPFPDMTTSTRLIEVLKNVAETDEVLLETGVDTEVAVVQAEQTLQVARVQARCDPRPAARRHGDGAAHRKDGDARRFGGVFVI